MKHFLVISFLLLVTSLQAQYDHSNLKYLLSEGYSISELEDLLVNMPVTNAQSFMKKRGYELREEVPEKSCLVYRKGEVVTLYAYYYNKKIQEVHIHSSPQKYYQAVNEFESGKYKQMKYIFLKNVTMKDGYKYYSKGQFLYFTNEDKELTGILYNYPPESKQKFKSEYLPEMVLVKGGEFRMGSDSPDAFEKSKPSWNAQVADFFIGKFEVTVREYLYFCDVTGRNLPTEPSGGYVYTYPITNVSWYEAEDYCDWLSYVTGKEYSLPYETQWTFAAQGGTKSKGFMFAGSDFIEKIGWLYPKGKVLIKAVGNASPNELNLYNMSSNVWEWCWDWYDKSHFERMSKPDEDFPNVSVLYPKGPLMGTYKILKGGGGEEAKRSQVSNRLTASPKDRFSDVGFRIVMNLK